MATRPLGPGTCNLSVNVKKAVRATLGRRAFLMDVSMGELARRMLAKASAFFGVSSGAAQSAKDDEEAASAIESVTADGRVTQEEIPALLRAARLVKRSGRRDRQIADAATL